MMAHRPLERRAIGPRDTARPELRTRGPRPVARREASVRFEVRDEGTGMTPEVAARAGEPFYTTRAAGAGFGLFCENS